jgi:hypothetical protein
MLINANLLMIDCSHFAFYFNRFSFLAPIHKYQVIK